jgi:hypothetical protein
MKLWSMGLLALLLCGCASYDGRGLEPGVAHLDDVQRVMGQAAMRWDDTSGSAQLAYPRAPMGYHTYMVSMAPDGTLRQIENVLDEKHFARIQPGMGKDEVLRTLGPPYQGWTAYYQARDELAWEWRYCDQWNQPARFDVLLDNGRGTVRSTASATEGQLGICGGPECTCGH